MAASADSQSSHSLPRQRPLWVLSAHKRLFSHVTRHSLGRSHPSLKCMLYNSVICALAPSAAGLQLDAAYEIGESGDMGDDSPPPPFSHALYVSGEGPGPPQSPSHPRSTDTDSVVQAYQNYHIPTSIYRGVDNGSIWSQEPSQSHEPDLDPDLEDVGAGLALTRTMTGSLSEYHPPLSMPSPRQSALWMIPPGVAQPD